MFPMRYHEPLVKIFSYFFGLLLISFILWGCDDGATNKDDSKKEGEDSSDAIGAVAGEETRSACLDDVDPNVTEAVADELFGMDHVPTFDIHLSKDKWEELMANAVDEQYTEAEVCFEGRGIGGTVGLRFKGSYGTLYDCFEDGELVCPRLSIKLNFNKYEEGKRFYGLKRLNFNANRFDDSRIRERLAFDLYRSMDIIAPRAAWAVVRVNGQSYGLYGMVEQIDEWFTYNRFPEYPHGNLYKELWPTDTDSTAMIAAQRTNKGKADVTGFQTFANAIAEADEADVLTVLEEYTDLDYWLRYMAVDDGIVSYDGITYFWTDGVTNHNHNYYFYEDSPDHFTLIPWDAESSFWIDPSHDAPHWLKNPEDCDLTYDYWDGLATAPGCDPIFKALRGDLDGWRKAAREFLDGPFTESKMIETIDKHVAMIGDEARAEETPVMYTSFDEAIDFLKSEIPNMRARLEALIAED